MTAPGCDPSVYATAQASASEGGRTQGEGGKSQRDTADGAIENRPTLSRRLLLLQVASLLALYWSLCPSPAVAWGLPKSLPKATVQQMKDEAHRDVKAVLGQLNRDLPGVVKQVVEAVSNHPLGSVGLSFGVLSSVLASLGSVTGLSAAGITSGLAAAGGPVATILALLGVASVSPMVAGVGVFTATAAFVGYTVSSAMTWMNGRDTKPAEKLEQAIQKLETIQVRLQPTRYFRSEVAEIKAYIKEFEQQKSKLA